MSSTIWLSTVGRAVCRRAGAESPARTTTPRMQPHHLRDPTRGVAGGLRAGGGGAVVAGPQRVELDARAPQAGGRVITAGVVVPAVHHQARVGAQAMRLHGGVVGGQTRGAVAGVARVAGDEGNALVAVPDQVVNGLADAAGVVGGDHRVAFAGGDEQYREAA